MRKVIFSENEYYHIYNRGVDKRRIFNKPEDLLRFLKSMQDFNTTEIEGGIYIKRFKKKIGSSTPKLVEFIAYCLNQNHYHFILKPLVENGIQKFMHRLSTGYTNYFNEKHTRSGSLFQGRYKAVHIETNEQLLHTSIYVNLNDQVHGDLNESWLKKLPFSSFLEYQGIRKNGICNTSMVLNQYNSSGEYCNYADSVLRGILKRKEQEKELKKLLLE